MGLSEDVKAGRLEGLRAVRDALAAAWDDDEVRASERAAIAGRLMVCLAQIEELEKVSRRGSVVDEISDRRKARRADAKGAVQPGKRGRDRGAGSG